ncbi:hypothetical protein G7046_g6746 [Stylonectria norvegica]|nr:hypothetical protein G7046_g6746 [Stylonectria norvegica]
MTAEVSHGRGGAGNFEPDDTKYGDGEVVRSGVEGSHGDGAYSSGRGGAGNIGDQDSKPSLERKDEVVIPEAAVRPSQDGRDFHTGRGGAGNGQRQRQRQLRRGQQQQQQRRRMGSSRGTQTECVFVFLSSCVVAFRWAVGSVREHAQELHTSLAAVSLIATLGLRSVSRPFCRCQLKPPSITSDRPSSTSWRNHIDPSIVRQEKTSSYLHVVCKPRLSSSRPDFHRDIHPIAPHPSPTTINPVHRSPVSLTRHTGAYTSSPKRHSDSLATGLSYMSQTAGQQLKLPQGRLLAPPAPVDPIQLCCPQVTTAHRPHRSPWLSTRAHACTVSIECLKAQSSTVPKTYAFHPMPRVFDRGSSTKASRGKPFFAVPVIAPWSSKPRQPGTSAAPL